MKTITSKIGQLLKAPLGYRAPKLGERELEVMKICWQFGCLSAKEILEKLSNPDLSLSSLQTTLERLYRKKLLFREKAGRFYVYRAAISRSEIITQLLGEIAEQISDGEIAPMISGFMDFIEKESLNPEQVTIKKKR